MVKKQVNREIMIRLNDEPYQQLPYIFGIRFIYQIFLHRYGWETVKVELRYGWPVSSRTGENGIKNSYQIWSTSDDESY